MEFRLQGEEDAFWLSPMWSFVDSGQLDRRQGRRWYVDRPEYVAGLIRKAIRSSQTVET
jgi:hypothetical protein